MQRRFEGTIGAERSHRGNEFIDGQNADQMSESKERQL